MVQTRLKPHSVFTVIDIEHFRLLLSLIPDWNAVPGSSIHIDVLEMVLAVISTFPYLLSRATLSDN